MARFLVDTNVISELAKSTPNQGVLTWLSQNSNDIALSTITVKELYFGALRMSEGRRKQRILACIDNILWLYERDILPFDHQSAQLCARLHVQAIESGRTPQIEDLQIASICNRFGLMLVTRNTKDFEYFGISCINPFD